MLADIVAQKESPYFYQNQKQTNKNWEARNNPHDLLVSTCQLCWFSPYTCLSTLVPLTVFPLPPANSVLPWPQVLSAQALAVFVSPHLPWPAPYHSGAKPCPMTPSPWLSLYITRSEYWRPAFCACLYFMPHSCTLTLEGALQSQFFAPTWLQLTTALEPLPRLVNPWGPSHLAMAWPARV